MPDIVILSVRPVELTRIILQGDQFLTGRSIHAGMGVLRGVPSDLIARSNLNQQINVSTYCLGATLLAGFEDDRLGIGIPYKYQKKYSRGGVKKKAGKAHGRR